MNNKQVIIPKFLSDESVSTFFSNCYQYLGKKEQAYWNSVLKNDYDGVKDILAKIINKTRAHNNLNDLKKDVESKYKETKKNYEYWSSEELKSRKKEYSLLNPTEFCVHNAAVRERDSIFKALMYWRLFDVYLCTVLEENEGEKLYFNDSGLKEISERVDTAYIRGEIKKIREASLTDSMEAIGKAKEILETTYKYILEEKNEDYGSNDDLNALSKKVKRVLGLDEYDKGPGSKTLISGLNGIVSGLSELRNRYGDGHGKDPTFARLPNCFGRLAVSSASTYIEFILQYYEECKKNGGGETK